MEPNGHLSRTDRFFAPMMSASENSTVTITISNMKNQILLIIAEAYGLFKNKKDINTHSNTRLLYLWYKCPLQQQGGL